MIAQKLQSFSKPSKQHPQAQHAHSPSHPPPCAPDAGQHYMRSKDITGMSQSEAHRRQKKTPNKQGTLPITSHQPAHQPAGQHCKRPSRNTTAMLPSEAPQRLKQRCGSRPHSNKQHRQGMDCHTHSTNSSISFPQATSCCRSLQW
jgi:hypothetical protein